MVATLVGFKTASSMALEFDVRGIQRRRLTQSYLPAILLMTSYVLAIPSIEACTSSSADLCVSLFGQVPLTLHVSHCGRLYGTASLYSNIDIVLLHTTWLSIVPNHLAGRSMWLD